MSFCTFFTDRLFLVHVIFYKIDTLFLPLKPNCQNSLDLGFLHVIMFLQQFDVQNPFNHENSYLNGFQFRPKIKKSCRTQKFYFLQNQDKQMGWVKRPIHRFIL